MRIDIKHLTQSAKTPVRAKAGDAGSDLFADHPYILAGGDRAVIKTGIAIAVPEGYYARVAPRSGLAVKAGIDVLAGVIDAGFRSEVGVVLINHGTNDFRIDAGDRIAQLIIEACHPVEWNGVTELPSSERGENGFGSSGT